MQLTYDSDMFVKTFESEFTWLNGFMRNVRRFGNRTAVIDPARNIKWTYTELNTAANKFANAMKADGVKKGDVVFMQLFNSTQFLLGYISPQKLGAIGNPANFNLSPGETAEIIGHNKPTVYVYDTEILDTVVKALEITSHTPKVIIAVNNSGKEIELPQGHILFEDYIKNASEENPPVDFEPHIYDEVVRLQTSGTTKGCSAQQCKRSAFGTRCNYAFPAQPYRHYNEYDAVVPPWRFTFGRSYPYFVCRRMYCNYA